MTNSKATHIILVLLTLIAALFIVVSILTGYGNAISKLFAYAIPVAIIFPFISDRSSFYTLFVISPFIDTFKRLIILFPYVSIDSMSMVLAIPLCLFSGLVAKNLIDCIFSPNAENRKFLKNFFITSIFVSIMTAGTALSTGGLSLKSIYSGANSSIYLLLIPLLPRYFSDLKSIMRLFIPLIIIYLVPALWCIKQGIYGLADFEYRYLKSGLTIEIRQLNERVMRNFGTMVSASALSNCCAILAAALLFPFSYKKLRFSIFAPLHIFRLLAIIIFIVAIYYTFTRTAWFVLMGAIFMFFVLKYRFVFLVAVVSGAIGIITLYASAQWIFDQKILNKWQSYLITNYGGTAADEQYMVLGTFNGRLESMAGVMSNRGNIWRPFGSFSGKISSDAYAHDFVAESLWKYGYIPMAIAFMIGIFLIFKLAKLNFSLRSCSELDCARIFFSLFFGLLVTGLSHGAISGVFPVNLFISFFLASGIHLLILARKNQHVAQSI